MKKPQPKKLSNAGLQAQVGLWEVQLQQGQLQVFHVPPALVLIKFPSMWHQRLCMMASNNLNLTSMSE